MKVQTIPITKTVISDVPGLDPITIYTENLFPARGKVTIECYSKSWSAYWGNMGKDTALAEFFCSVSADYIVGCLDPGLATKKYDPTQAADQLKKLVLERRMMRREGRPRTNYNDDPLDKQEARQLWALIDRECFYDDPTGNHALFSEVLGEEWWGCLPTVPNPTYQYLCRVVTAVQQAFKLDSK
jgi:hypothetical protein